jgi:hypothetical protein
MSVAGPPGELGESDSDFFVGGQMVTDVDEVIGNHSKSDPSFHSAKPFVSRSL